MTLTEAKNKEMIGMCTRCGEWTDVTEPCCNAGVEFEGHVYHLEDFEDDIDTDPKDAA